MKSASLLSAVAIIGLTASPAFAGTCDAVMAAWLKGFNTPTRNSFTTVKDGKASPSNDDTITYRGKTYSKKDGAWNVESQPLDEAGIRKDWASAACTPGGTEMIAGETADIFFHHDKDTSIDDRFWISRSSGLILKDEITLSKSLVVIAIREYSNVQVPDVAQK